MFTRISQPRRHRGATHVPAQRSAIPLGAGPAAALAAPLGRRTSPDRW